MKTRTKTRRWTYLTPFDWDALDEGTRDLIVSVLDTVFPNSGFSDDQLLRAGWTVLDMGLMEIRFRESGNGLDIESRMVEGMDMGRAIEKATHIHPGVGTLQ